jgi:Tfp pilus assembly protein PilN
MRTVQLNHALTTKKITSSAMILLITGALMLAGSIFYFQQISNKTHRLEADIEQLTHSKILQPSLKVNSKEYIKTRDEVVAVNAAISEIVMPWTSVFKTLEATDSPDVKLMSVEPNIKKQALRMNAVAMDVDSMMRYVDDLSQQKMLKSVALVTQQSADINGQPAVHFVVEARW